MRICLVLATVGVALLSATTTSSAEGDPDPVRGAAIYRACAACHSLQPGLHLTGPSLAELFERPAGTAEGFGRYSDELRDADFAWETGTLDTFLADPQAMFPGTYMTFAGIADAAARADLIAFLADAATPGGIEELIEKGVLHERLAVGQVPPPLGDAPPEARVAEIRHCGDSFFVTTEAGTEVPFWEKNVRIKIDSAETGPPAGVPVILGAGMQGDRVSVIFANLEDVRRFLEEKC